MNPLLTSLCRVIECTGSSWKAHDIGLKYADRIAGAQNGGEVVRLVDMLQGHRQISHAVVQNGLQSLETAR